MSTTDPLEALGRASRRAAIVGVIGLIVLVGSILYSGYRLRELVATIEVTETEIARLEAKLTELRTSLESVTRQLTMARARLRDSVEAVSRAVNLARDGRFPEAIKAYREALNIDPENPFIYEWLGYALHRNRQYEEAAGVLTRLTTLRPDYARGYYNLALPLWRLGREREALEALSHAIRIRPGIKETIKGDPQFLEFRRSPAFRDLVS